MKSIVKILTKIFEGIFLLINKKILIILLVTMNEAWRWQDEIVFKAGRDWMSTAKDKEKRDSLEEAFILKGSTLEGD